MAASQVKAETYLHVELLQFLLLARSIQRSFLRTPGAIHSTIWISELNWVPAENFGVIVEILPIDKELKSNEIQYCRACESCGFNNRNATLQVDFFPTSSTLELELFSCVLFHRTKFEFSFFFTVKVFQIIKLLLTRVSSEVDVGRRSCPLRVTCSPFISQVFYRVVAFLM